MSSPDPEQSTRQLIVGAKAGDEKAMEELMQQHLPALRAFVRARSNTVLRMKESSSDLLQTVCREALQHLDQYEWQGVGTFRYWLFSLAVNKLKKKVQYHRAAKRNPARERRQREQSESDEQLAEVYRTVTSPSQNAMAQELVENIEAALDKMPEQYREVILLSRVVGLSHGEIAKVLEKNDGAVRVLLGRALARLATELKKLSSESSSE